MGTIKTTNGLGINGVTAIDIDSTGAIQINSTGGALSMGNDNDAQAINIGTGSAARTITIGNTTGASAVNINIGTGDFTMTSASGTLISQLDTGEMTKPLQPAFLATIGSVLNVTGAGTTFKIGTGTAYTEIYDQGSDFNTNGTFTAPVSGRYELTGNIGILGMSSAMTSSFASIITSNRTYAYWQNPFVLATISGSNAGVMYELVTAIADMDAADTASYNITLENGAGDTADIATGQFSGALLV